MDKQMWDYFGVEPKNPEKVSVIGVDFGAGEMTACYIKYVGQSDKKDIYDHMRFAFEYNRKRYSEDQNKTIRINLKDLSENLRTNNDDKRYMYTIFNDERKIVGEQALSFPEEIYTNIKTTPENAKKNYRSGQGVQLEGKKAVSYQYLQEKTFCGFIQDVLRYNEQVLCDEEREVYLFVGRPSSNVWEEQVKDYQEILKKGLSELKTVKLPTKGEIKVKFHVIVYSEAEAAMAYEYKKGKIGPNEVILIIDGGSSTFDCVVVKNGEVINEYSRQVGAGMIEQNLFDLCLLGEETARQDVAKRKIMHDKIMMPENPLDQTEGHYIVDIRRIKEDFYGPKGIDTRPGVFCYLYNGQPEKKIIDSNVMDIAINQMPVRVVRSYLDEIDEFGGNLTQDYQSFRDAVEVFFQGAKARCFDRKTGRKVKVDRIILTGGATVMPFVQEIAERVFEVEANGIKLELPGDDRHYSVSNGLAYMGYVELTKSHELKKLKKTVHLKLEKIKGNIDNSVWDTCTDKLWKECYIDQIAQWTDDASAKTLQDWVKMQYCIPIDAVRENLGNLLREKRVIENINQILDAHFHQLFPQKGLQYHYKIQQDDILTAFSGQLQTISVSLTDMLSTGQKWAKRFSFLGFKDINIDTVLTYEEKKKIRDHIREDRSGIRMHLKAQIIEKTAKAREQIYKTILHNIDNSLENYMEGLTPYFVKGEQ